MSASFLSDISAATVGQLPVQKYTNSARMANAFARGNADYYYDRKRNPHLRLGPLRDQVFQDISEMSVAEIAEYNRGYDDCGDKKDWG